MKTRSHRSYRYASGCWLLSLTIILTFAERQM